LLRVVFLFFISSKKKGFYPLNLNKRILQNSFFHKKDMKKKTLFYLDFFLFNFSVLLSSF